MKKIFLILLPLFFYSFGVFAQSISGTLSVCVGTTTTLSGTPGSGTWSSSNTAKATVGSSSGVVTGVSSGTAKITYFYDEYGSHIEATVTVDPLPTLTGISTICVSATAKLTPSITGGTWSSSDAGVASVSGGIVTGVSTGTAVITYARLSCNAVTTVDVPSVLTGKTITAANPTYPMEVCEQSTIPLTTDATAGGVWSSNNTAVATIGTSGVLRGIFQVSGVQSTASIQYIYGGGCVTAVSTVTILPRINTPVNVCLGSSITATITPTTSGTWEISEPDPIFTLTVNPTNPEEVVAYGNIPGAVTLLFDRGTRYNCAIDVSRSQPMYVVATEGSIGDWEYIDDNHAITHIPGAGNTIKVCVGQNVILNVISHNGTWSASGISGSVCTSCSHNDFYSFTAPGTAGTATVTFTSSVNTCTANVNIQIIDPSDPITGTGVICVGSTTALTYSVSGGTWSSGNTSVATVGSTGIVTGITAGTATISYQTTRDGCYATKVITVNETPAEITGPSLVCVGSTITLTDSVSGGIWSSSNTSVATVGTSSGIVLGIVSGTTTISYTITGCVPATKEITVNPLPAAITGTLTLYCSQTTTLSSATSGGTWGSSNTSVATVGTSGIVSGVSPGTAVISYTLLTGCYSTATVTVNAPVINGTPAMCIGATVTLTGTPSSGTWSSSDIGVATVGTSSGIVTGVSAGTANITYTKTGSCYASKVATVGATFNVTVCEIEPIRTCDAVVAYCTGLELEVAGGNASESTTYSWSPSIPATKTMVGDNAIFTFTAAPTSGVYTVTVTKDGCSQKKSIQIVVASGGCYPCSFFMPCADTTCDGCDTVRYFKTITAATLSNTDISESTPGNYYIPHRTGNTVTLNVSPAVGSVFFAGQDITMKVSSAITLDGVHILSSPTCQWDGISIVNNNTARLVVKGNTLIEHASYAAVYLAGTTPTATKLTSGANIIESKNAIYNMNSVGIYINPYTLSSSDTIVYPFLVEKSIFTSRDFCEYFDGGSATATNQYPFKWPAASYLKTPVTTETGINPGFNIDYFPGYNRPNNVGITLTNVGYTDSVDVDTFTYYGVTIGDADTVDHTNMFDTLGTGISIANGNARLYNNIYRLTPFFDPVTNGPYANTTGVYGYLGYAPDHVGKKRLIEIAHGSQDGTNNRFYNCHHGFLGSCWYSLTVKKAKMSSSYLTTGSDVSRMNYGIKNGTNTVNRHFGKQIIENNTIINIRRGIFEDLESCYNPYGKIRITGNMLSDTSAYTNSEYGGFGIQVQERASCSEVGASLLIESDTVIGYLLGIYVSGKSSPVVYSSFGTIINNNTVIQRNKLSTTTLTRKGIACFYAKYVSDFTNNEVYGDVNNGVDYNSPAPSSIPAVNSHVGIELQKTSNTSSGLTDLACNYVHDIASGFRFLEDNSVHWHNNVMARNFYGMVLHNVGSSGGIIGDQVDTCNPMDNMWLDDGSTDGGWPSTGWGHADIYQTYSYGSDASLSELYVRDLTGTYIFKPTDHGYNTGGLLGTSAYSNGTNVILASTTSCVPALDTCAPYYGGGSERPGISDNGGDKGLGAVAHNNYIIFPNPSHGNLTIKQSEAADVVVNVKVINYAGAIVQKGDVSFNSGTANLNVGKVTPGMYMIVLTDDKGETTTFRVVIQ